MFEKYEPNENKMSSTKTILLLIFTIVWENLVQISSLVTEIQNDVEKFMFNIL